MFEWYRICGLNDIFEWYVVIRRFFLSILYFICLSFNHNIPFLSTIFLHHFSYVFLLISTVSIWYITNKIFSIFNIFTVFDFENLFVMINIWVVFKALETKKSIVLNFFFVSNTILSCFFLFLLVVNLYFLILAVNAQIFSCTAKN